MRKQGVKFFGFLVLTQLFFGIASYFILKLSSGNKVMAAYMCSAACAVYGIAVLIWHKKKHTDAQFWKNVRILAIIMLAAAVFCFVVAPFPDLYSVRGMTSAAVIVLFK